MISLTDAAVKHLQNLIRDQPDAGKGLRLGISKGGCAGLEYVMSLDQLRPDDEVVERDGAKVMIAPDSRSYLAGSTIDYCDDLTGTGFRIANPQAARSCGCGTSFEPAVPAHAAQP